MKLGIIGLPHTGKSTIFTALTGARGDRADHGSSRTETRISTVTVFDERLDYLNKIYKRKKTVYTKIEYMLPSEIQGSSTSKSEGGIWNQVRICDALLHVVRNFKVLSGSPPTPEDDFRQLEEEMILSDMLVAEKRIEGIELDKKRGKKLEGEEYSMLRACYNHLEKGQPLRSMPELASDHTLRGFTFLSSKPVLVILNNDDEDEVFPKWKRKPEHVELAVVRGRLEMDLASMTPDESKEFLEAFHIQEFALDRVIKLSFDLLNRISFFTVGSDEVKAWSITANTAALDAAGTVHSDMKQGFIKAEVLSFEDLKTHSTYQECKKSGLVRLEGKKYEVKDGDIINFRFNV